MLLTPHHAFLFQQNDIAEDDSTPLPGAREWTFRNRRFPFGRGILVAAEVKVFDSAALGVGADWSAAFPLSLERFPLQGSGMRYIHAGISPQAALLPVGGIHKACRDTLGGWKSSDPPCPPKYPPAHCSSRASRTGPHSTKFCPACFA